MAEITASALRTRQCKPCEGGVEPLTEDGARALLEALDAAWTLTGDARLLGEGVLSEGALAIPRPPLWSP